MSTTTRTSTYIRVLYDRITITYPPYLYEYSYQYSSVIIGPRAAPQHRVGQAGPQPTDRREPRSDKHRGATHQLSSAAGATLHNNTETVTQQPSTLMAT